MWGEGEGRRVRRGVVREDGIDGEDGEAGGEGMVQEGSAEKEARLGEAGSEGVEDIPHTIVVADSKEVTRHSAEEGRGAVEDGEGREGGGSGGGGHMGRGGHWMVPPDHLGEEVARVVS